MQPGDTPQPDLQSQMSALVSQFESALGTPSEESVLSQCSSIGASDAARKEELDSELDDLWALVKSGEEEMKEINALAGQKYELLDTMAGLKSEQNNMQMWNELETLKQALLSGSDDGAAFEADAPESSDGAEPASTTFITAGPGSPSHAASDEDYEAEYAVSEAAFAERLVQMKADRDDLKLKKEALEQELEFFMSEVEGGNKEN
jgi:hypothetical protein